MNNSEIFFKEILHIFFHSFEHTLKTLPLLFFIYLLIGFINGSTSKNLFTNKMAPVTAGFLGVLPQCGFSVVGSELYNSKIIKAGTLITIFISTSDEFLPIILSSRTNYKELTFIILTKLILAIVMGFVLNATIFKNEITINEPHNQHNCKNHNILSHAFVHTIKIALVIFLSTLVLEILFTFVSPQDLEKILLTDTIFQPILTAFIGIIPGCYISILLSELFLSGSISIGSALSGLSTGAGFGYVILFKGNKKQFIKIISIVYIVSVLAGIIIDFLISPIF